MSDGPALREFSPSKFSPGEPPPPFVSEIHTQLKLTSIGTATVQVMLRCNNPWLLMDCTQVSVMHNVTVTIFTHEPKNIFALCGIDIG